MFGAVLAAGGSSVTLPVAVLVTASLAFAGLAWKVGVDAVRRAREDGEHSGATDAKLDRIDSGVSSLRADVSGVKSSVQALDANVRRVEHDMGRLRQEGDAARHWRGEIRARVHDLGDHAQRLEDALRMVAEGDGPHAVRFLDRPRPHRGPIHTPRPQSALRTLTQPGVAVDDG